MANRFSNQAAKGKGARSKSGRLRHDTVRSEAPHQRELLSLQKTVGNSAVNRLLQLGVADAGLAKDKVEPDLRGVVFERAGGEAGTPLETDVRAPLESKLGVRLDGVRVHSGPASEAAADSLDARAYAIGSDIHLGSAARRLSVAERTRLLAHEAVHTVQQGGNRVPLTGKLAVSKPADGAEREAETLARTALLSSNASPALALRDQMRITPVAPLIQRDIVGDKTWPQGKLEINFKKQEPTATGTNAVEDGKITFTPSATAPESDHIRFIQIVRTTDKSSGTEKDFTWTGGEAARNVVSTKRDYDKNIAPGFYIDAIHSSLTPRTKKSDPAVVPYYDLPGTIGKRRGATRTPATLEDTPGGPPPGRFLFVTSVKASDTGVWYGTVLWGFELFLDDKGVQKIKGEYHSFRTWEGETTDAALKAFNEHYKNPGASTAPTT